MRRAGRGIVCRTVYCVRQGKSQHHDPAGTAQRLRVFIKQSKKISTYFDFFEKTCPFSDSDVI